jgi:hypothetical protein
MLKQMIGKLATMHRPDRGSGGPRIEGAAGIRAVGHRTYVGGLWHEIGRHQFDFLVRQGLKPSDCFLDIACGCLRGGIHFIDYLDSGNYLGIDKEPMLIELGIRKELGRKKCQRKKPLFVVSDKFEFEKFTGRKPQFSLAQSLFTHITQNDICLCFDNLRRFVAPGHLFFASFVVGDSVVNPDASHSREAFYYSKTQLATWSESRGWQATYIGDWQHPRSEMMVMKFQAV